MSPVERYAYEMWRMPDNHVKPKKRLKKVKKELLAQPEEDQYYKHIKEHKEQIEADFKEQQSEERWYANSLGDGDDI